MNTPIVSRTLLGDTPATRNFLSLLAAIENAAHAVGLYLVETSREHLLVLTFSDEYLNEVGEIKVVSTRNFCQCGRSAITLQAPSDMAWLLWARSRA